MKCITGLLAGALTLGWMGATPFKHSHSSAKERELRGIRQQLKEAKVQVANWTQTQLHLEKTLALGEIRFAQSQLEKFESQLQKVEADPLLLDQLLRQQLPTLFHREREMLSHWIDASHPAGPEAQEVLDRILRLITQLNQRKVEREEELLSSP